MVRSAQNVGGQEQGSDRRCSVDSGARGRLAERALVGLAFLALAGLATGCGKSDDLSKKLANKEEERKAEANAEVDALVAEYTKGLMESFPEKPGATEGDEVAIRVWRQKAATGDLIKRAQAKAAELEDTPSAPALRDGALIFQTLNDYWLGRLIQAPKKKDDEYVEAPTTGAEAKREPVPLAAHLKTLEQLASKGPYKLVWDLESLLPHLVHMYRYKSYKGVTAITSFSAYWQALFQRPRKTVDGLPEPYQSYRDGLCAEKLDDKCSVPYESRDIVIKRLYVDTLIKRLDKLVADYPDHGLEVLSARVKPYLVAERDAAVVPEEYPVMPATKAPVPASDYTVFSVGAKGAELATDDPSDRDKRLVKPLLDARDDWDLDGTAAGQLSSALSSALSGLSDDGAGMDYTSQIFVQMAKGIPVGVLRALEPGFGTRVKLLDFVGRRHFDKTFRKRRYPGTVVEEELRKARDIPTDGGNWSCLPLASLSDSNVPPDLPKRAIWVDGKTVKAGAGGKAEVTATLGEDLSAITKWTHGDDVPTTIAFKDEVTYEQLHQVLDAVAIKCDGDCTDPKAKPMLVSKLLVALCGPPIEVVDPSALQKK